MKRQALLKTTIPRMTPRRGKVRDIYDFGDKLLFIASDRTSVFDRMLSDGIPDKGRVLTGISEMWFNRIEFNHHLIGTNLSILTLPAEVDIATLTRSEHLVRGDV